MSTQKVPLRQLLDRPIDVPTGEALTIFVPTFTRSIIEMEDVNFHFDSPVLLPDPDCHSGAALPDQDRITGLAVVRACLLFAQDNTAQKLLIAGHTDTTGKADYNLTLSKLRADNVLHVLVGNRDDWAAMCDAKARIEDYQHILKWIASAFGWPCDPGGVDNRDGPKTRRAVLGFQTRYNVEFEQNLAGDGLIGPKTWREIFDVYMLELKELLETNDAELEQLRGTLKFVDAGKKTVGCGESHPVPGAASDRPGRSESETKVGPATAQEKDDAGADEFRSVSNRRVELLFFESGHEPKFDCHPSAGKCNPSLCEVYDDAHFDFEHIPCPPRKPRPLEAFWSVLVDPDWKTDDLSLVVADESGKEQRRLPASGAESGPGPSLVFDLSEFGASKPLVLDLRDANEMIFVPAQRVVIQELRQTLASDGRATTDNFALAGDRAAGSVLDGQDDQIGVQIAQNATPLGEMESTQNTVAGRRGGVLA